MTMTDLHVWKTTWWELYNNKYPWLSRHKLIIFKFFFGYQDSYCVGNCEAWRKPTAIVTGGFSKGLDWKRLHTTTEKQHPFECLANKFVFVDVGNWMETNIWAKKFHQRWSKKQQRCGNWVRQASMPAWPAGKEVDTWQWKSESWFPQGSKWKVGRILWEIQWNRRESHHFHPVSHGFAHPQCGIAVNCLGTSWSKWFVLTSVLKYRSITRAKIWLNTHLEWSGLLMEGCLHQHHITEMALNEHFDIQVQDPSSKTMDGSNYWNVTTNRWTSSPSCESSRLFQVPAPSRPRWTQQEQIRRANTTNSMPGGEKLPNWCSRKFIFDLYISSCISHHISS